MTKPILVATRRMPEEVEARARRDYDARLNEDDRKLSQEELLARCAGATVLICSPAEKLEAATVEKLPDTVKVIGTFSVGYDHVPVPAVKARGFALVNTPDVLSVATAEIAMLLILAASRRAGEGERIVRANAWTGWCPTQLIGRQVSGRRLGIFGLGRIGREVARMAKGFEMEVHYRDQVRLPPELEKGAVYHDNDESFLKASEVLSLNAPGGEGTRKWLDAKRIAMLPKGAVVVNAARGSLMDDEALIAALKSGQVSFAGLDVYDGEPKVNPGYIGLENVVLLPHLGSATRETRIAMGNICLDGIDAVLAGKKPANLVV